MFSTAIELNEHGLAVWRYKYNKNLFVERSYKWLNRVIVLDEETRFIIDDTKFDTFDFTNWIPVTTEEYKKVKNNYKDIYMKQVMVVLQGCPGSGKSTLAVALAKQYDAVICSTDDYFMVDGEYKFDPNLLGKYHKKNIEKATDLMLSGRSVIVDNTNIFCWQALPYCQAAVDLGIEVIFKRATGDFQSVHGVPQHAIDRMRSQMEELTLEKVLASVPPFKNQ